MFRILNLLFVISLPFVVGVYYEDSKRLYKDLFQNYSKDIRPTQNVNQPTLVIAILNIYVVYDLVLETGHLVTRATLSAVWRDDRLIWDPDNYGNITKIYPTSVKPWMPNIIVCNSEEETKKTSDQKYGLEIHEDGYVEFWQSMILRTFCEIDIYMYPFDKQECEIWICLLETNDNHAAFDSIEIHLNLLHKNRHWDIQLGDIHNSTKDKSVFGATVYLTRKSVFSSVARILPTIVLSILTLCIFLLPAESGEKVSLATAVFLSNVVYLVQMDETLKGNSNRPALLLMYLILLTSLSGLGTIGAIIVCKVYLTQNENDDANQKEGHGDCGSRCKTRTSSISVVSEERDTRFELDKIPQHEMRKKKKNKKYCGHRQLDKIFLAIGFIIFLIFAIIFGHFFNEG